VDFWSAAIQSLPQLGIMSGFGYILILLLRREASSEARHARELDRMAKQHDMELAERDRDVDRERAARRRVEKEIDQLRSKP